MALLELRGIEKRFGATVALDGADFEIAAGEVHALIGENGAGKSTLLNILSGLIRQDGGEMRLSGETYAPDGPAEARRRGIAHIHQELALCPHLSVAENMFMGSEPSRRGWLLRQELFDRAAKLLEEFGRSEIDPRARTGNLSLPDQQVVEICRALACEARVILMDEPTSSLQRPNVERLFRLIRQLRDRGIAVVYISHFLEEVREIADRYTVIRDGRSVGSGELKPVGDDQLIAMMVGRDVAQPLLSVRAQAGVPVLHEVVLTFDNLQLHRGEILGIAGLIGSGRSELLRAIFERTPSAGYLPEDRKREGLAMQLSIADNVTMSRFSTCALAGWIDLAKQAELTEAVMRRLHVKAAGPRSRVFRLSGGNQQKVVVGRLLHQDPDILLLDEPARGIDIGSKSDIFREIAELAASGKAILMVSSYLPELFAICDRIAVMTRGRLSPAQPVAQWTPESVMQVAVG